MTNNVKAEFHCHTEFSPDSQVTLKRLLTACDAAGIEKIAITDHGTMRGAVEAHRLDPQRVILAEEILTSEGEILAYFMTEEIPQDLHPLEVVKRLQGQGAFISIAHPFDPYRGCSWREGTLEELVPYLDGVEVFNARCARQEFNDAAYAFAMKHGKALMAGSDAHSTGELGRASLTMPDFNNAEEMRLSLRSAEFSGSLSSMFVHVVSTYAKLVKKIKGK